MSLLRALCGVLLLCVTTAGDVQATGLRNGKKHHKHHRHHKHLSKDSNPEGAVLLANSGFIFSAPRVTAKPEAKNMVTDLSGEEPNQVATPQASDQIARLARKAKKAPPAEEESHDQEIRAKVQSAKTKEAQIGQLREAFFTEQNLLDQSTSLVDSFKNDGPKSSILKAQAQQTKGMMQKDLDLLKAAKEEATHSSQEALEEAREMHEAALQAQGKAEKERAASMQLQGKANDLTAAAQAEVESVESSIQQILSIPEAGLPAGP
mmetsp:Transcript_91668/g.163150  ORF Transcript_91668/g.163150 Transcript_91668/m.163150 type:complete len:264 (-) Transcript_91668:48-839(-)|eukprot:CAMPEP_0197663852 /NCGR_PEP_ID=MMETSP1338-20131121/58276_1 /TAXON_ID=43686 ORGANISM="Pelagodinium beii, Strain RCC1491" /NCGR_SAMPLE_ID=MMETSP1338 /ASSEMBLY_ACC=CAM_ASM_000754 /LENGTH=263 /DNA_ID=CAMNT_0043242361 /DNA_START=50 /DNA_END=841 /DNA_ORIENTATION=+